MKTTNVEIKKLGINGEGIGYINRKITFVKGALPGEKVLVEVTNDTRNFKEAKLVEIIEPSKDRVEVTCRLKDVCLGCPIQHLNQAQQLYFKKDIIRDSLRKYTQLDIRRIEFRNTVPAITNIGYKDTVHLPIARFQGRIKFGIFQRESKYLTVMNNCQVQNPIINKCLNDLEAIFNELNVPVYSENTKQGLRFVTIRVLGEKVQLIFVTGRDRIDYTVIDRIEALDYVGSVFYTINTYKGQDFTYGKYEKLAGKTQMEYTLKGRKMLMSAKTEYPINTGMVETVIDTVNSLISPSVKNVLEINCGNGWLSLNLPQSIQVKALDFLRFNIDDAKLNAKFLKQENCEFESGKMDEMVPTLTKNKEYDAFIVNVDSLGMRDSIKNSLIKGKIKELIYLSTSPSSFAKDVADLEKYYKLDIIIPVDTMPQTQGVQIIAKLKFNNDKKRR